jgi:DNA-binding NarL/FixJ family response regulator
MKRDTSKALYRPSQTPETNPLKSDTSAIIKVMVQDYHDLYREAFITLLRINGINVIADLQNGIDVLDTINPANLPDIAIINYKTSNRQSLNAACSIKEQYPGIKIIINSQYNYGLPIDRIKQIGIEGIIIKAIHSTAQMVDVIHLVYNGDRFYSIDTPAL